MKKLFTTCTLALFTLTLSPMAALASTGDDLIDAPITTADGKQILTAGQLLADDRESAVAYLVSKEDPASLAGLFKAHMVWYSKGGERVEFLDDDSPEDAISHAIFDFKPVHVTGRKKPCLLLYKFGCLKR